MLVCDGGLLSSVGLLRAVFAGGVLVVVVGELYHGVLDVVVVVVVGLVQVDVDPLLRVGGLM